MTERNARVLIGFSDKGGRTVKKLSRRMMPLVAFETFTLTDTLPVPISIDRDSGESVTLWTSPNAKGRFRVDLLDVPPLDSEVLVSPWSDGESDPKLGVEIKKGEMVCILVKSEPRF